MKKELFGGIVGSVVSGAGAGISLETFDRILSIICSVSGILIAVITCIIIPLIKWYKNAKADGKITKEELEEGKEIAKNGIESVKNAKDKSKKD